jgi:hypothetical protein
MSAEESKSRSTCRCTLRFSFRHLFVIRILTTSSGCLCRCFSAPPALAHPQDVAQDVNGPWIRCHSRGYGTGATGFVLPFPASRDRISSHRIARQFPLLLFSLSQSFEDFKTEFCRDASLAEIRNKLKMLVVHKDDGERKLCVFFADDEKIGVSTVKAFAEILLSDKVWLFRQCLPHVSWLVPFCTVCLHRRSSTPSWRARQRTIYNTINSNQREN